MICPGRSRNVFPASRLTATVRGFHCRGSSSAARRRKPARPSAAKTVATRSQTACRAGFSSQCAANSRGLGGAVGRSLEFAVRITTRIALRPPTVLILNRCRANQTNYDSVWRRNNRAAYASRSATSSPSSTRGRSAPARPGPADEAQERRRAQFAQDAGARRARENALALDGTSDLRTAPPRTPAFSPCRCRSPRRRRCHALLGLFLPRLGVGLSRSPDCAVGDDGHAPPRRADVAAFTPHRQPLIPSTCDSTSANQERAVRAGRR